MLPRDWRQESTPIHEPSPTFEELAQQAVSPTHEPSPMDPVVPSHASVPMQELSPIGPVAPRQALVPTHEPVPKTRAATWGPAICGGAALASAPVAPSELSRRQSDRMPPMR